MSQKECEWDDFAAANNNSFAAIRLLKQIPYAERFFKNKMRGYITIRGKIYLFIYVSSTVMH